MCEDRPWCLRSRTARNNLLGRFADETLLLGVQEQLDPYSLGQNEGDGNSILVGMSLVQKEFNGSPKFYSGTTVTLRTSFLESVVICVMSAT